MNRYTKGTKEEAWQGLKHVEHAANHLNEVAIKSNSPEVKKLAQQLCDSARQIRHDLLLKGGEIYYAKTE